MKPRSAVRKNLILAGSISLLAISSASAAYIEWTSTTATENWLTPGNWTGSVVAGSSSTTTNTDGAGFSATDSFTINIDMSASGANGNFYLGAIDSFASNSARTIQNTSGSSGILRLNGYNGTLGTVATNNVVIRNAASTLLTIGNSGSGTLGLNLANATANNILIDGTGGITINSAISGSNGLVKLGSGSGILTLAGNNTYSGVTSVNTGTLTLGHNNALGATGAGNHTIVNGGNTTNGVILNLGGGTALTLGEDINLASNSTGRAILLNNGAGLDHVLNGNLDVTSDTSNAVIQSAGSNTASITVNGNISGTFTNGALLMIRGTSTDTTNRLLGSINLGSGNLIKTDAGLWIIGATNKTYSWGNTQVSQGTLRMGVSSVLPSATVVTIGQASNTDATLDLNGTNQTVAGIQVGGSGVLTITSTAAATLTVGSASDYSYAGVLTGTGLALTKTGAGNQTLSGANTYAGGTTIKAGTLTATGASSSGTSGPLGVNTATVNLGDTTGSSTATLSVTDSQTHLYPLVVQTGSSGVKTLAITGSNSLVWGSSTTNITLNDSLTLDAGSGSGTINLAGNVIGNGGVTVNFTGTGSVTLSRASSGNTYAGNTTITRGILKVASATAIPNGAGKGIVTLNPSTGTATFDLSGQNQTINGLTSSGAGSAIVDNVSTTDVTLIVGTSGSNPDGTFAGTIRNSSSGKLALTKSGAGTLTLSGTNTYTGNTLVSGGTLQFAKQVSLYNNGAAAAWTNTNINVNSGATMAFNIGGSGEFTKANIITLLGLSNATTNGFKTGAILGLDTTAGDFLYDSVIANPNSGTNVLGLTKLGTNKLTLDQANTFTGGVTVSAGTLVLAGNNTLSSTGANVSLNGGTLQLQANVGNTSGSTSTAAGLVNYSGGTSANTPSIAITANNSVIQLRSDSTVTFSGTNWSGVNNKTFTIDVDRNTVSGTGGILTFASGGSAFGTNSGAVQLNVTGNTAAGSGYSLALGTLANVSNSATVNSFTINPTTASVSVAGFVDNNPGGGNATIPLILDGTAAGNTLGSITKSGNKNFSVTKSNISTWTLTGTNTYTGKTTVQAGTLSVSADANLGGDPGSATPDQLTIAQGATLEVTSGFSMLANRGITISGGTGTGLINLAAGQTLTINGTIAKNGTKLELKGGIGSIFNIGGAISGSSASSDLIVNGGTTNLNTANSYNGPTSIINGGTLNANVTGAMPASTRSAVFIDQTVSGTNTGSGSSTLALGASQSIASLSGQGTTGTSLVNLNANTLTIGTTSGSTTFAGNINGTNGSLIKDGASTQVLSGSNGYTGSTTVAASGGTLEVKGSLSGTSGVTVNTGGTLLLNNSTNNTAVTSSATFTGAGGTLKVADSQSGRTNTFASLSLGSNGVLDFGTGSNGISNGNTLVFTNSTGAILSSLTLSILHWSGTTYTSLSDPNTDATQDRLLFTNLTGVSVGDTFGGITFFDDSGNALGYGQAIAFGGGYEIVPVPEPATTALIGAVALCGLIGYRERRRIFRKPDAKA